MSTLARALRSAWEFVVGDDWRLAAGVVAALGATALARDAGISAWWILPVAIVALLWSSVLGAARHR